MNINIDWLQEYIKEPLPKTEELAEIIALKAFEIDGVEKFGESYVLDVDILPNRAHDCLSHRGIAREVCAIYNLSFKNRSFEEFSVSDSTIEVRVEDETPCNLYSARVIRNICVGPSPEWLKSKLESIGQRSVNNVVDVTNYVMFDLGQPMHAFDLSKISGRDIFIRKSKSGESLITLDGDTVELNSETMVISDKDSPLAIAGVKGGKKAEVDVKTVDIVLESANFDPVAVRKVSRSLNIFTESSKRFENKPSPEYVKDAMAYATQLIKEVAGTGETVVEKVFENRIALPTEQKSIDFSVSDLKQTLGIEVPISEVEILLKRIGCRVEINDRKNFSVIPPEDRYDLDIREDLYEEVGRLYGYEHLSSKPLSKIETNPVINKDLYYMTKIRQTLQNHSFSEVFSYSIREKGPIKLQNPPTEDRRSLRDELSSDLQNILDSNVRHSDLLGVTRINLFEISNIFTEEYERTHCAIGVKNINKKQKPSAEDVVKKVVESISQDLGVDINPFIVSGENESVFEFDLNGLIEILPQPKSWDVELKNNGQVKYHHFSQYPFVLRDLAVFTPEGTTSTDVLAVIKENAGELLVQNWLFDVFEKTNEDGSKKTSYAFRLVFQSYEKTLSDDEINVVMSRVYSSMEGKEGWEIR